MLLFRQSLSFGLIAVTAVSLVRLPLVDAAFRSTPLAAGAVSGPMAPSPPPASGGLPALRLPEAQRENAVPSSPRLSADQPGMIFRASHQ